MAALASVRVQGLAETIRALEAIERDLEADVKALFLEGAELVGRQVRAPRDSGRLAGTLKVGPTRRGATVKIGGARAVYAPVIEFGWARRNIRPRRYMSRAIEASRDDVQRLLSDGFSRLFDPVR